MEDEILIEKNGFISTVSINRPEKRNALNLDALIGLKGYLGSLKDVRETRVVVIRGAGDKAFCAGMDIGILPKEGVNIDDYLLSALEAIMACPCVVIAMINGHAAGAGCDISSACDFRIAADSARLGITPVKLGWVYYYSSIQRIINLVGPANTKELFFTGRLITAQRAKEMGLVNYVVPLELLSETVYSLAQEIVGNAPLAVSGTKAVIRKLLSIQDPSTEAKAEMQAIMDACRNSEDGQEGARAFLEKRKPVYKGK